MKYLLILFLGLVSICKADPSWSTIDVQPRDIAFVSGYIFASVYDLSQHKGRTDSHAVGWKMGLGLIGGLGVGICHAVNSDSAIQFTDIVFGGLGGLTCVVVRF